jgi:antitoxin FitA
MPTTLTLKNIPAEVYEQLKRTATANRRSLNSEAIMCIESALQTARHSPEERLVRARALRARLNVSPITLDEVNELINEDRDL